MSERPPDDDPAGPPPAGDPAAPAPWRGAPPAGDPLGAPPSGEPAAPAPSRGPAPPADLFAPPARANAEGAIPSLVLGILSVVFCPLCAPFAWYFGRRAERLVDASGGMLSGRGEATAGKILGIVMTILMILGILLLIALIVGGSTWLDSGDGGGFESF